MGLPFPSSIKDYRVVNESVENRKKRSVLRYDVSSYEDDQSYSLLPEEVVLGSNPFANVLVNEIISEKGLNTATQADLEEIIRTKSVPYKDLEGLYEDSGLVLINCQEPNSYLANDLLNKIKEQNQLRNLFFSKRTRLPVMIPLKNLRLRNDDNSPYGLAFDLIGETIYAPILKSNDLFYADINKKTGLPKSYTRKRHFRLSPNTNGLNRFFMSGSTSLVYDDYRLFEDSDKNGRIIVINPKSK